MKNMYDIRTLLKKYGIFIYTGNKLGDLELMEYEIRDLYNAKMIPLVEFQQAILIIKREASLLQKM
ncbi:YqgQ family protein [Pseudogracilibacillus auburnensis]|uniref:YqgQ family protein n=1 Tax=Pseudogracilibacillus auburnensis TaxID=1494959 RepID=UPI001A967D0B|nr:YqgQ family protein [Pseudogracilibacillus auburnensis]MBO1003522.1 YqgQ family protein [Pseudogracilibacillus auburnensis]